MPARRKPLAARQDNRASRARGPSPEVREPLGNAPVGLAEDVVDAWREIAAQAPRGVLTRADRGAVELAARLLAEYRADPLVIPTTRIGILVKLLGSFGCTPQGRLGLSLPLSSEASASDNPFARLD